MSEALVAPAVNERATVWDTVIAGAPGAVVDVGPMLLRSADVGQDTRSGDRAVQAKRGCLGWVTTMP